MTTTKHSSPAAPATPVYACDEKAADLMPGMMIDNTRDAFADQPTVIVATMIADGDEYVLVTLADGVVRSLKIDANVKTFRAY